MEYYRIRFVGNEPVAYRSRDPPREGSNLILETLKVSLNKMVPVGPPKTVRTKLDPLVDVISVVEKEFLAGIIASDRIKSLNVLLGILTQKSISYGIIG